MMLKATARFIVLLGSSALCTLPAGAQTPAAPDENAPPALLQIEREEVRPGRGGAHAVNEAAWAAAYTKAQSPVTWLGMTTLSGANEAWFLSRHDSFASLEKAQDSTDAAPALAAERDRIAAAEGDMLSRTSTILARYRPAVSYQPNVKLPEMRYMTVDLVRVKSGRVAEFLDTWRMLVAAHTKAGIDEHWAVFEVESGMPDTTFLFMYPRKSLAELDAAGPAHGAAGFRDAVADSGRRQITGVEQDAIEMSETRHFKLRPGMSALSKEWATADAFWAPPAPADRLAATRQKK
jgi:hypothetical protein